MESVGVGHEGDEALVAVKEGLLVFDENNAVKVEVTDGFYDDFQAEV